MSLCRATGIGELTEEHEQVIGVSIHVISFPRLGRASMASSVMCYAAIAMRCEEEHLVLPVVAVQGPAVGEYNWLASRITPIFIKDLGLVFSSYKGHFDVD